MIYDFAEIEKYIPAKVTPNFGALEDTGRRYGEVRELVFNRLSPLPVFWNERTRFLKIRGSLAFAYQAHNYQFSTADLNDFVRYLQDVFGLTLFDAHVTKLEAGVLLEVPFSPEAFFATHLRVKGMKTVPFDFGRYFKSPAFTMKLYDAGRRLKQIVPKEVRNDLQSLYGYNPGANYIRIENHYHKPAICLKQSPILLADLTNEVFQARCRADLLNTYETIVKTPPLLLPEAKKDLTASTIPLIVLKALEGKFGFDAETEVFNFLKTLPKDLLPPEDRKKRSQQLRANFGRITGPASTSTTYDLTDSLREKLYFSGATM